MSLTVILIALIAIGIPAGMIAGYFLRKSWAIREAQSVEAKAQGLIAEAKNKQKELLLEAQEKSLKIIEEAKREEQTRRSELAHMQSRLEGREQTFDQKLIELEQKE